MTNETLLVIGDVISFLDPSVLFWRYSSRDPNQQGPEPNILMNDDEG
jgi:hypothetical protein